MKRIVFLLLSFIGLTATVQAQTFTQHLLQQKPGNGKITISQSHDIDMLVNGKDAQEARVALTQTVKDNNTPKKTIIVDQTKKTVQNNKKTEQIQKAGQVKRTEQARKTDQVRKIELNKAEQAARAAQEAKADSIEKARERWRREQEEKAAAQKAAQEKDNAVEEAIALQRRIAEKNAAEKAAEAKRAAEKAAAEKRAEAAAEEEFNIPTVDMRKKVMRGARKVTGYRVQAFAGGNTRADKNKAQQAGNAIKMRFPDQPIYVHFYSPRWICRVGNYRSLGEARRMLNAVKAMGYKSAIIVKGKITVFE
jgi:DNA polymerase III gamma/tau subunit